VIELWDSGQYAARGLVLRVFFSGRATWTFRYRPKDGGARRRFNLGDYPAVTLSEARRRVDRLRGEVSGGYDPQAALRASREAPTEKLLIDRYLEGIKSKKKPRTLELYEHRAAIRARSAHQGRDLRARRPRGLIHACAS
jgi:Arm DNA-binding domain